MAPLTLDHVTARAARDVSLRQESTALPSADVNATLGLGCPPIVLRLAARTRLRTIALLFTCVGEKDLRYPTDIVSSNA
jgi:hypothetical protein